LSRGRFWRVFVAQQAEASSFQNDICGDRGSRPAAEFAADIFDHDGYGNLRIFERSDADKPSVDPLVSQIILILNDVAIRIFFLLGE